MRPIALLALITWGLFFLALLQEHRPYRPRPTSPLLGLPGLDLAPSTGKGLWVSMVTGDTRSLPKEVKERFYLLGLGHLFTPSGVHLSSLRPVTRFLPVVFFAVVSAGALFLVGFQALARVALLKSLPRSWPKLACFLFALLSEGALKSWDSAPVSWWCSWMFMAICLFAPRGNRGPWFLLGQVILSWVFGVRFSPFAPLANFLFLPLFSLAFPVVVGLSLLPSFRVHELVAEALTNLDQLVALFARTTAFIEPLAPHFGHVSLIAAWLVVRGAARATVLASLLLVLSAPAGPRVDALPAAPTWHALAERGAVIKGKTGMKTKWSDGVSCERKLRKGAWEEICRPPRRRTAKK